MNHFFKLLHMEVRRFRYILAGLMGVTAIVQLCALFWTVSKELKLRETLMLRPEKTDYVFHELTFAWAMSSAQFWFLVPVFMSITVLSLYIFFIWYRDWVGRHTFVYRLLMLPTQRRNIYLAKLTAILIFMFVMLSFQLLLLIVENMVFNWIVPSEQGGSSHFADAVSANQALDMLLPHQFGQFVFNNGVGVLAVLVLFTSILLERSYRRIGILYGILYAAGCFAAVIVPLTTLGIENPGAYLYPGEIIAIVLVIAALLLVLSVWLGLRLLARKITV
ncbi:hypothetical protein [Cohnella sp.]|uniref:hypothetical protein n=1 Tax=Cohnella sp. TaxID=1883426 RepID=UPI00356B0E87